MIGLPSTLYDSYRAYKKDTNTVITAILAAAREVLPADILDGLTLTPGGTTDNRRLKGKARKTAKAASASDHSTTSDVSNSSNPTIRSTTPISLSQFKSLLDALSNKASILRPLPTLVLATLQRVLEMRKTFRNFYDAATSVMEPSRQRKEASSSNASHQHFLDILQRAHDLFSGAARRVQRAQKEPMKEARPSRWKGKGKGDRTTLTNQFEMLEVEEPKVTEFSSANEVVRHQRPTPALDVLLERSYQVEEDLLHEFQFAAWCLHEDLTEIRNFMLNAWKQYRRDEITFVTISCLMTLAVDISEAIEDAFRNQFPLCNSYNKWLDALYLNAQGSADPMTVFKGMLHIYDGLCQVAESIRDGDLLTAPCGMRKPFDTTPRGGEVDGMIHIREAQELILGNIGDWYAVSKAYQPDNLYNVINQDPLLRQTAECGNQPTRDRIRIHYVFAIQLHLDSIGICRDRLKQISTTTRTFAQRIVDSIKDFQQHNPEGDTTSSALSISQNTQGMIQQTTYCFVNDFLRLFRPQNLPYDVPYSLFYHNPWLSAMLYGGFVLVTLHTYNCLRVEGYLPHPIPIFEFLLRLHGNRVFQGRLPQKGDDHFKYLKLALGADAKSWAKDARKKDFYRREGGGRRWVLNEDSLCYIVGMRYRRTGQALTMELLEKHVPGLDSGNAGRGVSAVHAARDVKGGVVPLLSKLMNAMEHEQKETFKFGLDYNFIHTLCVRVMRHLYYGIPRYRTAFDKYGNRVEDDKSLTEVAEHVTTLFRKDYAWRTQSEEIRRLGYQKMWEEARAAGKLVEEIAGPVDVADCLLIAGVKPPADASRDAGGNAKEEPRSATAQKPTSLAQTQHLRLRDSHPNDQWEIISTGGLGAAAFMLQCLHCPDKYHSTGPGKTLDAFMRHLASEQHRDNCK
ncbi:hypothetical protein HDV00_002450 [Rhizophlyctis rosea]|nr:hypothetical protein HDV00_002450 [Rhizophlyctis rosea]